MGFLIALLAVLLLILIILVLKVSVRVTSGENYTLKLGVGIFRMTLYPRKEKTIRLSDYEIKKYRKKLKKQEEKERKKLLKKKTVKKGNAPAAKTKEAPKKRDIMGMIDKIREVTLEFLTHFGRHLSIKIKRLHITVATDNAASTAMLYGAVCGAVTCLLDIMGGSLHLKYAKDAVVSVEPDFTGTKTKAIVDITFSFRTWQLLDIIIRSAWKYYNYS